MRIFKERFEVYPTPPLPLKVGILALLIIPNVSTTPNVFKTPSRYSKIQLKGYLIIDKVYIYISTVCKPNVQLTLYLSFPQPFLLQYQNQFPDSTTQKLLKCQ